jgi:hypothetical protein
LSYASAFGVQSICSGEYSPPLMAAATPLIVTMARTASAGATNARLMNLRNGSPNSFLTLTSFSATTYRVRAVRRGLLVLLVLVAGACGGNGNGAKGSNTPRITVGADGPLAPGVLSQDQLRHVPGLSTATVTALDDTAPFVDPDPRGPCGAKVPAVSLREASGVLIKADTIRGGAELVLRLPAGAAQKVLDARMANAIAGCPEYATVTHQGVAQRVLLVRIVRLHKEFQQALAVVNAIKIGDSVRAATQIEVRRGDILARTVIFTETPLADATVRGIASLMGRNLAVFDD